MCLMCLDGGVWVEVWYLVMNCGLCHHHSGKCFTFGGKDVLLIRRRGWLWYDDVRSKLDFLLRGRRSWVW